MSSPLECLLPLPTPEEMRLWDEQTVNLGLPGFTLMENAARAALQVLRAERGPLRGKRVLLFMGQGNNGGDAACLARQLLDAGALPLVLHTRAVEDYALEDDAGRHVRLAVACQVPMRRIAQESCDLAALLHEPVADIIVDALLGTGFQGELREPLRSLTAYINKCSLAANQPYVLALDVPSGLNALTGQAAPDAVRATATVSFAAAKPGMVLPEAQPYTGEIFVRAIGIPLTLRRQAPASYRLLNGQCAALLPPLPSGSYKNAFGHVLVVGGSAGLTGAAHLAALAALRSGAGLVTAAAPAALASEIKGGLSDIMTLPLHEGILWPCAVSPALRQAVQRASALVVGPGMGRSPEAVVLLAALLGESSRPPAVLDADAINVLADHPELWTLLHKDDILTPHPGEAGRVLNITAAAVQENRQQALRSLTALAPCCWVLKGAGTLVGQGQGPVYVSPYDVPTLAVGGSGDVLAGCAGALLGHTRHSLRAALLAVAAHARAGHILLDTYPLRGNLANNIAHSLPPALASLAQLPEICRVER